MKMQSFKLFALALVFGAAAFFGTAGTAAAQTKLSFETSFDFQVGNDKMNAGKYELTRVAYGKYVLRNVESNASRIVVGQIDAGDTKTSSEQVIFNRYGERYFLRQIFAKRGASGIDTGESSAEKEVRKGDDKLAKDNGAPSHVAVNLTK